MVAALLLNIIIDVLVLTLLTLTSLLSFCIVGVVDVSDDLKIQGNYLQKQLKENTDRLDHG